MVDGETEPRDIILKRRSENNNSDYQRIYENNLRQVSMAAPVSLPEWTRPLRGRGGVTRLLDRTRTMREYKSERLEQNKRS